MGTVSQTAMAILLMAVPTVALGSGNPATNAAAAYETGFDEIDPDDLEDYDLPDYIDDSASDGGDVDESDEAEDDWLDDPDDLIDELGDYNLGDLNGSFSTWGTDVNVHSQPNTDAEIVEVLTEPTTVAVSCQLHGDLLSAEGYNNDWWTYLPKLGGYVSNIYIDTPESVLPGVPNCNEAVQGDVNDQPDSENPEWRRLRHDDGCLDEYFQKDGETYHCTPDGPVKVSPYSCYDNFHKQDRAIFGVDGPPTEWFVSSQFNCYHWNHDTLGDGCAARGEFTIYGSAHGAFEWTGYDMCPDGARPRLEVRNLAGEWFTYKAGPVGDPGAGKVRFLVGGIDRYRFSWRGAKTESFEFGKEYPDNKCFGNKNHPKEIPCPDKPQDWLPPYK